MITLLIAVIVTIVVGVAYYSSGKIDAYVKTAIEKYGRIDILITQALAFSAKDSAKALAARSIISITLSPVGVVGA